MLIMSTDQVDVYVSTGDQGQLSSISYLHDLGVAVSLTPLSGSFELPVAWVNNDDWPCSAAARPRQNRVIVKTGSNVVDYLSGACGDVLANVQFGTDGLDSLSNYRGVEQVYSIVDDLQGSQVFQMVDDSNTFVSTALNDVHVFVLADSANVDSFCAELEDLDGVAWATPSTQLTYSSVIDEYHDPRLGWPFIPCLLYTSPSPRDPE